MSPPLQRERTVIAALDRLTPTRPAALDVTAVHEEHGDFVWASLQRLGARPADIEDLFQEVFVVVHRRNADFDPRASLRSWLYGICVRVVSGHRKRAWVRREQPVEEPEYTTRDVAHASPEALTDAAQGRAALQSILDDMDLEKRAIFVMYELDELSCDDIASTLGVALGTVYSRLHAARKEFDRALARYKARNARRGVR